MKPRTETGRGATSPTVDAARTAQSPQPSGSYSVSDARWSDLRGWDADDHLAAFKAFQLSCPRLIAGARPPAGGKPGKLATPPDLLAACDAAMRFSAKTSRIAAKLFFERHFTPQRIVHASSHGLLTGYFEPVLEGSRSKTGRFQTPIHRRPADLVTIIDETQRGTVGQKLTHARQTAAGLMPFATRAEIVGGALKDQNLELIYLEDPVDVFFLQVQGSGRIKLTDGTVVRVHYDGKNGHPYTSIGRHLIDKGLVAADKMTLGALGRWLRADPKRGQEVMNQNASYVFFKQLPDDAKGPLGALEVPLTPGRSLAIDPSMQTLGAPIYVTAPTLTHAGKREGFHRLMIAQDVGSAIKGPERGDIFFGSGEAAGRIAGVTKHAGNFFRLEARPPVTDVVTGSAPQTPKQAKP